MLKEKIRYTSIHFEFLDQFSENRPLADSFIESRCLFVWGKKKKKKNCSKAPCWRWQGKKKGGGGKKKCSKAPWWRRRGGG